jgi:hypothetical protein
MIQLTGKHFDRRGQKSFGFWNRRYGDKWSATETIKDVQNREEDGQMKNDMPPNRIDRLV